MMLVRKLFCAALPIMLYASTSFANVTDTQVIQLHTTQYWKLNRFFVLTLKANKPAKVDFYVSPQVVQRDGTQASSDTVEVNCDGTISKVVADAHLFCELEDGHQMSAKILPEDYAHGSQGTWSASPL